MSRAKRQAGFTMLEILIALLVLSLGMLGLAGLMATSLRNGLSASHRTQATWMAYDIIDRMRANRALALSGSYTSAVGTPGTCSSTVPTGATAAYDLTAWRNQIACVLPAGDGAIAVNGQQATVTIQWNDSRGVQGSATQAFSVSTQL
jgi:type IV pilus modification protein PilV